MEEQQHPDPDRWWNRKWKLAKIGGICAILSILLGQALGIIFGPEHAETVRPLATTGMWGGLSLIVIYAAEDTVENVAKIRRH